MALEFFAAGTTVTSKADGSPVTPADSAVERSIVDELTAARADDAVIGEELGVHGDSDRMWNVDPIDGTSFFIRRRTQWRVQVALTVAGRVEVAVVTAPAMGLQWWTERGAGAFEAAWPGRNDVTRLAVSTNASLADAVLDAVDDPSRDRLPPGTNVTPHRGDGWCAGLIAMLRGEVDGFLADRFRSWDHAPWVLLVEEAGGRFTPAEPAGSSTGSPSGVGGQMDVAAVAVTTRR